MATKAKKDQSKVQLEETKTNDEGQKAQKSRASSSRAKSSASKNSAAKGSTSQNDTKAEGKTKSAAQSEGTKAKKESQGSGKTAAKSGKTATLSKSKTKAAGTKSAKSTESMTKQPSEKDSKSVIQPASHSNAQGENNTGKENSWREEISVAGTQLVDKFKELITQGNIRRIIVKQEGNTLIEVPLTAAVVGGALALWAAPIIPMLAAIAGVVAHVTIEIERAGDHPEK